MKPEQLEEAIAFFTGTLPHAGAQAGRGYTSIWVMHFLRLDDWTRPWEAFRHMRSEAKLDYASAWINLGNAYHELQKAEESLEAYDRCGVGIDPTNSRKGHCNRGGIALV